jgi:hypothetical protein
MSEINDGDEDSADRLAARAEIARLRLRLDGEATSIGLRDYFAAKAMQGLLSQHQPAPSEDFSAREMRPIYRSGFLSVHADDSCDGPLAEDSYAIADAMLAARES